MGKPYCRRTINENKRCSHQDILRRQFRINLEFFFLLILLSDEGHEFLAAEKFGAERAGLHSNCSGLKETVMAGFCIFVITRRGCRKTFNITQHKARLIGLMKKVAPAKHMAMTPVCK